MARFQFTHPGRGATPTTTSRFIVICRFNSRTPGGVRLKGEQQSPEAKRFNSRTPGGVRQSGIGG